MSFQTEPTTTPTNSIYTHWIVFTVNKALMEV